MSVVSYDGHSLGNGAVRGELQISTIHDRLDTRRSQVPRLAVERVDKQDTSSPKGGRCPVLYLLMGSKLVPPVTGCDSDQLHGVVGEKTKVV